MKSWNKTFIYSKDEEYPIEMNLNAGSYLFELWGAQAITNSCYGGKGAYVAGTINLKKTTNFYLFIGSSDGYNGGGIPMNTSRGGGATDIRLINSTDFYGLASRIIVAAGGGANCCFFEWKIIGPRGGDAGGLNGSDAGYVCDENNNSSNCNNTIPPTGGTQSSGGQSGICVLHDGACFPAVFNGTFGKGGTGAYAGGGGGYFGGGAGNHGSLSAGFGAGGSSYVSGYQGCLAVDIEKSTSISNITMKNDSYHYSGLSFTNITFKSSFVNY